MINTKKIMIVIMAISVTLILQACGNAEPKTDDNGINDAFNNDNVITVGQYGGLYGVIADNNDVSQKMEHFDIKNDAWFNGLQSDDEKLCRKYLGQPQAQGLSLPNNYNEAIDYLRKALFFFPDNPSYMTDEQKKLFQAPCFWSGMKTRFIYGGYTMDGDNSYVLLQPSQKIFSRMTSILDASRYYVFTRRFFENVVSEKVKRKYCESTEWPSSTIWEGRANFLGHTRNCGNGEVSFYSNGESNYFYSQKDNTQLNNPNTNSKFISDIEVLLVVRNMRFGSDDGYNNYSYIKAKSDDTFAAFGKLGARGVMNKEIYDSDSGNFYYDTKEAEYKFNPFEIIKAINQYGEIAIDLNRPSSEIFKVNDTTTVVGNKVNYKTDWSMQPNEHTETKNIAPKVQYWGWQTENHMFIYEPDFGTLIHEMLHNMGYTHGDIYDSSYLYHKYPDSGIDVAYYIGDLFNWDTKDIEHYNGNYIEHGDNNNWLESVDLENRYYRAVIEGAIPSYFKYHTPSEKVAPTYESISIKKPDRPNN